VVRNGHAGTNIPMETLQRAHPSVTAEPLNTIRYLAVVLGVFAPISAILLCAVVWLGSLSGAILLPEEMGAEQNADPAIVALPFHLRYWAALKLPRIAEEQPEIVSIGSSRGMELRSAMFAPYKFYNASLSAWTVDQEITMVDRITQVARPRIIIVGLDYFMFQGQYARDMARERTMRFANGWWFRHESLGNMMREFWNQPALLADLIDSWRIGNIPIRSGTVKLLGLDAIRGVTGFRFDGSMLLPQSYYASAPAQIAANKGVIDATLGGPAIDPEQYDALERLAAVGRQRGIKLAAIQFPMLKTTVDYLDYNPAYHDFAGVWREFESAQMRERLEKLGFIFFDMSHDPMTADSQLFIDAAHPTESGMSITMMHLLDDPRFRALVPDISAERLRSERDAALQRGDKLEVYGNSFAN
jgi:hypothetical protein